MAAAIGLFVCPCPGIQQIAFQPLRIRLNISRQNAPVCNPGLDFAFFNVTRRKKRIGTKQNALTRARRRLSKIEKTGATFLITDLDVAMTFTRIAGDAAQDSEKRNRNLANARHAYDDVSRMSHHASLTDNERQNVDDKLAELRSALEQQGEVFA
jgi:hypothetical protein